MVLWIHSRNTRWNLWNEWSSACHLWDTKRMVSADFQSYTSRLFFPCQYCYHDRLLADGILDLIGNILLSAYSPGCSGRNLSGQECKPSNEQPCFSHVYSYGSHCCRCSSPVSVYSINHIC